MLIRQHHLQERVLPFCNSGKVSSGRILRRLSEKNAVWGERPNASLQCPDRILQMFEHIKHADDVE